MQTNTTKTTTELTALYLEPSDIRQLLLARGLITEDHECAFYVDVPRGWEARNIYLDADKGLCVECRRTFVEHETDPAGGTNTPSSESVDTRSA